MPIKRLSHLQQARAAGRIPSRHPDPRAFAVHRGYDRAWRKLRLAVLREEPACRFCPAPAVLVDHITPINAGGERMDRDNLRPVCRGCHDKLTANYRKTGRNEMP